MKRLLVFLFTSFTAITLSGQLEWVGNLTFSDELIDFHKSSHNQIILVNRGLGEDVFVFPEDGYTVFDSLGNQIVSMPFNPLSGWAEFHDLIEMPDSTIVFMVDMFGCGFFGIPFLIQFDSNWNELPTGWHNYGHRDIGVSLSDGTVVLASKITNGIDRRRLDGIQLWSGLLPDYELLDMLSTPSDTIFIATNNGLVKMDKHGGIDTVYTLYVFEKLRLDESGNILGVKSDSLFLLSPDMELINLAEINGGNVSDINVESGSIALLTDSNYVSVLNDTLAVENYFQIMEESKFELIQFCNEDIILAGTERYGSGQYYTKGNNSMFVKSYGDGSIVTDWVRDVGVANISISDQVKLTNQGLFEVRFNDVKIKIRNHGDLMVDRLEVNAWFPGILVSSNDCEVLNQRFSKEYKNLVLSPGAEVELSWGDLYVKLKDEPIGFVNLCMWTSLPDFKLDLNSENDLFCYDFEISNSEFQFKNDFTIFPNPVSDILNIYFPKNKLAKNGKLKILDNTGRIIKSIAFINSERMEVQVYDLSAGIYFLQFLEDGILIKSEKFIVIN